MRKYLLPVGILFGATIYSMLRYVCFSDVSLEQLPLYIANKAISWTGLILLGLSPFFRRASDRSYFGIVAGGFISVHALASFPMIQPAYFPKFYGANRLFTWQAELSLLAGAVGTFLVAVLLIATFSSRPPDAANPNNPFAGFGRVVLFLTAGHVCLIGYAGWLHPENWPGYMPPITLLSFLLALAFLVGRAATVKKRR